MTPPEPSRKRSLLILAIVGALYLANQGWIAWQGNYCDALRVELASFGYEPGTAQLLSGGSSPAFVGYRAEARFQVAEAPGRVLEATARRPFAFTGWQIRSLKLVDAE